MDRMIKLWNGISICIILNSRSPPRSWYDPLMQPIPRNAYGLRKCARWHAHWQMRPMLGKMNSPPLSLHLPPTISSQHPRTTRHRQKGACAGRWPWTWPSSGSRAAVEAHQSAGKMRWSSPKQIYQVHGSFSAEARALEKGKSRELDRVEELGYLYLGRTAKLSCQSCQLIWKSSAWSHFLPEHRPSSFVYARGCGSKWSVAGIPLIPGATAPLPRRQGEREREWWSIVASHQISFAQVFPSPSPSSLNHPLPPRRMELFLWSVLSGSGISLCT